MLQNIQTELLKENVRSITLLTDIHQPAKSFYEKNGFNVLNNLVFMKRKI